MSYTYVNEDQIDVELKCIICHEPFQVPVNCIECGQTFCQECIDKWNQQQSSCPSCRQNGYIFVPVITRVVFNQLNRLLVQCSLCQQTNIQRGYFSDHISYKCPKQTVSCTNKCGWKGYRENSAKHLIKCQQKQSHWVQFLRRWNICGCIILAISLPFFL
jgi:hypothetical protein